MENRRFTFCLLPLTPLSTPHHSSPTVDENLAFCGFMLILLTDRMFGNISNIHIILLKAHWHRFGNGHFIIHLFLSTQVLF